MSQAEWQDATLRTYPGYTLSTLLDEDAHALMQMQGLIDPDVGKAKD